MSERFYVLLCNRDKLFSSLSYTCSKLILRLMQCVESERMNMEKHPFDILLIPFTLAKFVYSYRYIILNFKQREEKVSEPIHLLFCVLLYCATL